MAFGLPGAQIRDEGIDILHQLAPLTDPRWEPLVHRHPDSSVFHSSAWLRALQQTYGFEPLAFTSSPPDSDLSDAVLFCLVKSWLTGHRLVSLPYSDHCEPLATLDVIDELCAALGQEVLNKQLDYFELRPVRDLQIQGASCHLAGAYYLHLLDLTPDLDALYGGFHQSSVQRKIQRASREGLVYEEGRSEDLLDAFYRLLVITRMRHRVPSQPRVWFQNLIAAFGDDLKIRVASANGEAVASIMTIRHRDTMVYKYGCSELRQNRLGGMQFLLWNAIRDAKENQLKLLDLGRSDISQAGLIKFKERWGCKGKAIGYWRYSGSARSIGVSSPPPETWKMRMVKQLVAYSPSSMLNPITRFLFKHGA